MEDKEKWNWARTKSVEWKGRLWLDINSLYCVNLPKQALTFHPLASSLSPYPPSSYSITKIFAFPAPLTPQLHRPLPPFHSLALWGHGSNRRVKAGNPGSYLTPAQTSLSMMRQNLWWPLTHYMYAVSLTQCMLHSSLYTLWLTLSLYTVSLAHCIFSPSLTLHTLPYSLNILSLTYGIFSPLLIKLHSLFLTFHPHLWHS